MAPRMIFLVGSPLPHSLDWEKNQLLNTPLPPFYDNEGTGPDHSLFDLDRSSVKWRVLQPPSSYQPDNPHTTFYYGPEDPNFLTTKQLLSSKGSCIEGNPVLSEFYKHFFEVHQNSEVDVSELEYITQESGTTSDSMISTVGSSGRREAIEPPTDFQISGPFCDLQDIPTAAYLESIVPQTMTVNLIVGVIAIHPPRRVVTRQWKTEFDIIEMVVGDETRMGFGVNIWLPSKRSASAAAAKTNQIDRLSRSLSRLRPHDIILLRTVGLGSFQNRVYGQSLRGGMTQVDLLHQLPVDTTDAGGVFQESNFHDLYADQPLLLQKARRVREWIFRSVTFTDKEGGHCSGMSTTHGHRLPPDTQ